MAITLELYLDHQIIRGDLRDELGQRPLDLLNSAAGGMIVLNDAWTASLHVQSPPTKVGMARVRRQQILVVIPQGSMPLPPRRFRTGFVEKRPIRAAIDLGPFSVAGTIHVGLHEVASITSLEHDAGGRVFVPVTQAVVKSHYDPRWALEEELIFVNRLEISGSYPIAER